MPLFMSGQGREKGREYENRKLLFQSDVMAEMYSLRFLNVFVTVKKKMFEVSLPHIC